MPIESRLLRSVIIGTTGVCNASCIHCPTGKAETAHLPRKEMPLDLFEGIVRQVAAGGWTIRWNLSLGLFGDGLLDRQVLQRCALVRRHLPAAPLAVNTNGAAYTRSRHLALRDLVDAIALHVESLRPEVYDAIMSPLTLERVLPRVKMLMADFGCKVTPGTPLHRMNLADRGELIAWFKAAGARHVHFSALSNRCSDTAGFQRMSFAPIPAPCRDEIATDLIVDWDGQVFLCCNDFGKRLPIGDFTRQTLDEILIDPRRHDAISRLTRGRAAEIPTCARCQWDKVEPELLGAH